MVDCFSNCSVGQAKKCKYAVCASTLIMFLVLILLSSSMSSYSKEANVKVPSIHYSDYDLKTVHVIFRHGARTPADTYPKDPHFNETFEPYGWGQLSNVGKNQMFELGKFLEERYKAFIGENIKFSDIHAQCTGVSRTKMSIQLVLAGLYQPKNTALEWNKNLNWQPVAYDYEDLENDKLLLVRQPCPRYNEELERVLNEDVKHEKDENQSLFLELANLTGWKIETYDDIQSIYSTLKAEEKYGLSLPQWTKRFFPEKMQKLTDRSFIINAYNSELKKLKGGVFVKRAVKDWENLVQGTIKQKMFIYAGHDATVTNILSAFNVWEETFPDYGITAILELLQNKITKEYGVEILLRNSTKSGLHQLQIEGCNKFCPLTELKQLLQNNIPQNLTLECQAKNSNYTTPTPRGP